MKTLTAIPLEEYIRIHFDGNKSAFAQHVGLYRQNVNSMLNKNYVVIGNTIYRPKAEWGITNGQPTNDE